MPHTQTHYLYLVQFSVTMSSGKACNNSLFTYMYIWTNVVSRFKIRHQEFPAQLNPLHVQYVEPHSFPSSPPLSLLCSTSASRCTGPVTTVQPHHTKSLHSPHPVTSIPQTNSCNSNCISSYYLLPHII